MKKETKKIVVRSVSLSVMAVLSAALIGGNVAAFRFSDTITSMLSGTGEDFSAATQELKNGDALCQQIAEDSVTLLRNEKVNDKPALPLASSVTTLNVFGYAATDTGFLMKGFGSGSSTISKEKQITFLDAITGKVRDYDIDKSKYTAGDTNTLNSLKEEFGKTLVKYEVNDEILSIYNNFASDKNNKARPNADSFAFGSPLLSQIYNLAEPATSQFTNDIMTRAKEHSDVAVFVIGRDGGENVGEQPKTQKVNGSTVNDRTYLDITKQEEDMLKLLKQYFSTTIVVLNTTNTMHLGFLDDPELGIDACLYVGVTGQSGARAIPNILSGKVNPSGKYTDIVTRSGAVAKQFDPSYNNNEAIGAQIQYIENVYYGYKWYETADKEGYFKANSTTYEDVVMYAFGHGLSYTNFTQSIVSLSYGNNKTLKNNDAIDSLAAGEKITAKVKVTNNGTVEGKDVVQLYYAPPYIKGQIEKSAVNLLGFKKTGMLKPKESQTVEIEFTPYDMASYDCYDDNGNNFKGYELDAGTYAIKLMKNSHDSIANVDLKLNALKKIDKDPITGNVVENQFVGDGKYAGLGTDGAEAGVTQKWLSRADFSGTFPKAKCSGATKMSVVDSAANYLNNASYADADKNFAQGQDAGKYLWSINGNKATMDQLKKGASGLAPDYDLMKTLSDYNSEEWDALLDQMTVAEMKKLIEQGGFNRKATLSVGLRDLYDYDGPAGFNVNSRMGKQGDWTAYPSEALIGCSWNEQLLFLMGRAMGAEAQATGIHGWYAPGVNLHRSNYNARNFEYYSEDAVLSGKLAVQIIAGAKTNGLVCYLKHFACSEEGPNPGGVNTWITEQNLRENYLRPFEIAVKGTEIVLNKETGKSIRVGANAIMTAFNRVGASWAGAHYGMNIAVLRNEWGFNGTLLTDYTSGSVPLGGMNVRQGIRGGNDLWLDPFDTNRSLNVNDATDKYCARISAKNILYTVVDTFNTYNEIVSSGVELDQYQTSLVDKFKNVTSWWQPTLITLDILVFLGFAAWAVCLFVPVKDIVQKLLSKKVKETCTAEETVSEPIAQAQVTEQVQAEAPKAEAEETPHKEDK